MGFPLHVICCFSLVAFNIFSLYLIFVSLITVCLGVFLLASILPGAPCPSVTWVTVSFPMVGKFSSIISSYIFSDPFSFSSSSETSKIQMLMCWKLVLWPCVSSKGSLLCLRVDCWPCLYDLAIMEQSVFIFSKELSPLIMLLFPDLSFWEILSGFHSLFRKKKIKSTCLHRNNYV